MMPDPIVPRDLPAETRAYLGQRLDGARDLYLLALALGRRPAGRALSGQLTREARIHFAAVIEEARMAGLDTNAIGSLLAQASADPADSVRPELRAGLEQLLEAVGRPATEH